MFGVGDPSSKPGPSKGWRIKCKPYCFVSTHGNNGLREKERKRDNFWVDRKTCKKKRIATDLYYYYGKIEYKINACLKTVCKLYM